MYSPRSLIPFPLYGSGGFIDFIFAVVSPTNCLSIPDIFINVCFSTVILISSGIEGISTNPLINVLIYKPVPPTNIGIKLLSTTLLITSEASALAKVPLAGTNYTVGVDNYHKI